MSAINKALVINIRYLPDHLYHKLIRDFKPKREGYEHWNRYKTIMTQKEIDEVDMFILHWAKEHKFIDPSLMELPSEGSYIILFFHIGYEEWKAMYPDKLEERTCTGEKSK